MSVIWQGTNHAERMYKRGINTMGRGTRTAINMSTHPFRSLSKHLPVGQNAATYIINRPRVLHNMAYKGLRALPNSAKAGSKVMTDVINAVLSPMRLAGVHPYDMFADGKKTRRRAAGGSKRRGGMSRAGTKATKGRKGNKKKKTSSMGFW